ncbi:restriction endonuclease subunit S [Desulfobacter latus]|uniref:restriction endonuclease subunit S n=1 Tax=Desulfobacter latus TaxID=2292 RepID=UPI001C49A6D1|nr:restriction endonuclease subunit S [Desulfobacter latus]
MSADWSFIPLTELYEIRSGLSKSSKDFGSGYPFLSFKDVFYNFFVPETLTGLVQTNERERESCSIQRGDVFLTRTSETINELGMSCVALKDYEHATFNGFAKRLRPKSEVELLPEYVGYYLRSPSFRKSMMAFSTLMSTRASLNNEIIGRLKLLVPPRKEQEKIAHVLKTLDDKIQLNSQINRTLEEMVQAIFKSWFVDFGPVKAKIEAKANCQDPERAAMCAISCKTDDELDQLSPNQREQLAATAALFPDELSESELGLIPWGWEVRKIEDIIKRFPVGKKYSKKTASEQGDVPILDQGKSGIIGYHNDKPGVTASPDEPIIVFANHTCYMRLIMHNFSAIQNVLPLKGIDFDIYWVYGATYGKQEFIEYKGHWPDFVIKKVVVPNNQLNSKYGEYIGTFYKAIFQNDLQSLSLTELRDTLLPKLLSGEIDLSQVP